MNKGFIDKLVDININRNNRVSSWLDSIFDIINLIIVYFDKLTNKDVLAAFLFTWSIDSEIIEETVNLPNKDIRDSIMYNCKNISLTLSSLIGTPLELTNLMFLMRYILTYITINSNLLLAYDKNETQIKLSILNNINDNKASKDTWKIKEVFGCVFTKHNRLINKI